MTQGITKRKDGRYMARYMVTLPNGVRKRQAIYGKTREEVKAKRNKELAAAINGTPIIHSNLTVEEYVNYWLQNCTYHLRESTRSNYAGVFRKHIIPYIGKVKLYQVNTQDLQRVINQHLKNGGSVRVAQLIRDNFSSVLKQAVTDGLITKNVARYVIIPQYQPKEQKIWNQKDVQVFMKAIQGHKYQAIFELILTYGLRRGEAIGLKWEDIDLENDVIHIVRQYTYVGNGKVAECGLKTKNSRRDLPITENIRELLKKLSGNTKLEGPITQLNGEMVNIESLAWEFKRLKRVNNLPDVTLHSLRHFAATTFKDMGISIKDAQIILGHSSPMTTITYYQHSNLQSKKIALNKYVAGMQF